MAPGTGKPELFLVLGGGDGSVLVPSTGELSCHLPWQCRTTRIMAGPFCTLKGLAFYVHFVKNLRAFQGWAVLTSGRKIHAPLPILPIKLCLHSPLEQWLLRVSRVREGLSINCFVLRKCGDGQPAWRLMCTLELDPRLVDQCHLWTLSSDKAISRITSWGGGKTKALSNLETTVGAYRNRSRVLGESIRGSRDRGVLVLSFCVHPCPCLLPGEVLAAVQRAAPIPRTNFPGLCRKEHHRHLVSHMGM